MNERLLQFIWQFQYFNKKNLQSEQGERIAVIHPGNFNSNQGADFLDGKVCLGSTTWAGNIEIHLKSSDWLKHGHATDRNYSNVILHVVWENDTEIKYDNGSVLPTLVLQHLVPKVLLERFRELMVAGTFVPCEHFLPVFNEMKWTSWKERMALERLQQKSSLVLGLLKEANDHWEEVFWWLMARNFGMKVNAAVFESIARSLPLTLLAKHKNQIHQVECFLLGQAGLLDGEFSEEYPKLLKREYQFFRKKYQLVPVGVKPYFLRMRPANFPTIRLAQLAMLINTSSHLFSKLKESDSIENVRQLLNATANDYWHYHYQLDELTEYRPKQLGKQMTENLVINTVVPVLFAYGQRHSDEKFKNKALEWLSAVSPESNTVTKKWVSFGVTNKNGLESQGLLQLKNGYCQHRRCLECAVGNAILKERSIGEEQAVL